MVEGEESELLAARGARGSVQRASAGLALIRLGRMPVLSRTSGEGPIPRGYRIAWLSRAKRRARRTGLFCGDVLQLCRHRLPGIDIAQILRERSVKGSSLAGRFARGANPVICAPPRDIVSADSATVSWRLCGPGRNRITRLDQSAVPHRPCDLLFVTTLPRVDASQSLPCLTFGCWSANPLL